MSMPLDHIVIALADLERAVRDYQTLGFHVIPGGKHAARTSHNALVVFQDGAYLELIAWQAPAPQERWYRCLQAHGEGLVDFALLPSSTPQALAQAHARGLLSLKGPLEGGRQRPDGQVLQWQTARHDTHDLPFLCGDITPRHLRVPSAPDDCRHPNGVTGVRAVAVAVHDLAQTRQRYAALLGSPLDALPLPDAAPDLAPGVWPGTGIACCMLALPGVQLLLQSPASRTAWAGEPAAAQALRERLATRGEGPCGLVFAGGPASAGAMAQDLALTHGVVMERVPG